MEHREKNDVIFIPVFDKTRYLHHECSECKGEWRYEQSGYGGTNFYDLDKMKYCPLCGGKIVRFSDKPKYVEEPDLSPLDVFARLHREYERKAKWLYYCYISEQHRENVDKLIPLVKSKEIGVYYARAIHFAVRGRQYHPSAAAKRKLKKEFGEDVE